MKTWQMIKELTENPGKKFISKVNTDLEATANPFTDYIKIRNIKTDVDIVRLSMSVLNGEWEEVKEPVDFITAIESRHKVRVEHPFISHTEKEQFSNHYKVFTELLEIFTREWNAHDVRAVLLEGKWYIED